MDNPALLALVACAASAASVIVALVSLFLAIAARRRARLAIEASDQAGAKAAKAVTSADASARAAREVADNDHARRAEEQRDRQAAVQFSRRAEIVATSIRTDGQRRLILMNHGLATAEGVGVTLHPVTAGDGAGERLPWLSGANERFDIAPGDSVGLIMSSAQGTARRVRVDVNWSDSAGNWTTQKELSLA